LHPMRNVGPTMQRTIGRVIGRVIWRITGRIIGRSMRRSMGRTRGQMRVLRLRPQAMRPMRACSPSHVR